MKVKNVSKCEGDCDVNQRKGKITALFDLKLVLDIEGTSAPGPARSDNTGETMEDKDVTGTITIPEVAHDSGGDEYVVPTPQLSSTLDGQV